MTDAILSTTDRSSNSPPADSATSFAEAEILATEAEVAAAINAISLTEAEIAATIANERRLKAENIVKSHVMAAMPLGLVPIPVFDLAALTGNHLAMLKSLCRLYQHDCRSTHLRAMLASLFGAAIPVMTVAGLSSGAKLIPGIGTLIGSGSLAVTAGAVTYAIGQLFIQHVEQGGDLPPQKPGVLRARFKHELERGKAFAQRWRMPARAKSG